ncbi:MAG: ribonuclease R [Gammaproteobacteria bacterium RIFCSPHIGHO2_12_FULL_41_20]|nr:MAG: ribonuclease R [Gammaproteobacteria bacterium RIFCSPHIGHO2_12_FULL_41_20]
MDKQQNKKDPYAEREAKKYTNPIPSREFILDFLAERGQPATYHQLLDELGLADGQDQEALRRRLIAMVRDGQLLQNRRGAYGPLGKMELITGRVIGHKDGFGFVTSDNGGDDLFLGPRQMRTVFHGDRVVVRVSSVDTRGRREAVVVEILEHAIQQLVGRFFVESGAAFVEPVNQRIAHDILIPLDAKGGAKHGQMVVVAITTQPSLHTRALGKIIEVLGDHMAPGMEIDVAIRNHSLPCTWEEDVLAEAAKFSPVVEKSAWVGRTDLRHLPFVTIDGEDAKDFDDAVYCESQARGGWVLYVAIADVSHYVKSGTAIDREALNRGNSVYFPGKVIPMLPEVLSNDLCSLNPHVDRLAMVCEVAINAKGQLGRCRFYEAVFESYSRLTYTQVHAMIEKNDAALRTRYAELVPHLQRLYDLFDALHQTREKRGAIDFDLPETKIIFSEDRKIEKIVATERFNSHRVIEECMLCANICAARFLIQHKHPTLFRVHEGPSEEKLNDLRRFLSEVGLKLPVAREPKPEDYAKLLKSIQDRPDAHLIQTVLLRSLSQAVYSPENKGHFGLAYEAYAHFTSPIRRYPDLITHRAIKEVLHSKAYAEDAGAVLERYGEHCSSTERRADEATREAIDWLKCEFMLDEVGEVFSGVISGVTNFGIFVELAEIFVEGLAHISTLPDDYYQFDPIKHTLRGERSGRRFRLGDVVKVRVARVDLDEREIDFVLAEIPEPNTRRKKKARKRS